MALALEQYLVPGCFIRDLDVQSRDEALRAMVRTAAQTGLLREERDTLCRLVARVNVQSTALAGGVAIPHGVSEAVSDLLIVIANCSRGLDFGAYDSEPTRLIVLLIGNPRRSHHIVATLARVWRLARTTSFADRVAAALSYQDLLRALREEETKIA